MSQPTDDPDCLLEAVQRRSWWRHLPQHVWHAGWSHDVYPWRGMLQVAVGTTLLLTIAGDITLWPYLSQGKSFVLYLGVKILRAFVGLSLGIVCLGAWRLWRETHHHRERDVE